MKLIVSAVSGLSLGVLIASFLYPLISVNLLECSNCECGVITEHSAIKSKGVEVRLIIGILSARENFKERQVARETWLRNANAIGSRNIVYKFIVGDEACNIDPKNRKDTYSCDLLNFTYSSNQKQHFPSFPVLSLKRFNEHNKALKTNTLHIVWNASVIVRHPVVVKRIGLLSLIELSDQPITVQLYDEVREEVVLSARFSLQDPGRVNNDFETYGFQPVSHVLLPKNYECLLRILFNGDIDMKGKDFQKLMFYSINDSGGIVEMLQLDDKGFVAYESENSLFLGNLHLSVNDLEQLEMLQKNQPLLDEEYKRVQLEIGHHLEEENSKYNDILVINVTDVYRNLPLKLLRFHQWVSSELNTQFVMKTDDDCFVDIERILTMLDSVVKVNTDKSWLGNFRENWYVERVGKWAEKVYRSTEYPQFACGSGNIVSKDISDWLAKNAGVLFPFQGEDTSMGIWLSAISPRSWGSKKWLCDKNCENDAFVIPQLSTEEIRSFWESKEKCGNICGC